MHASWVQKGQEEEQKRHQQMDIVHELPVDISEICMSK